MWMNQAETVAKLNYSRHQMDVLYIIYYFIMITEDEEQKLVLGEERELDGPIELCFYILGFQNKHLKILARLQTFLQNNRRNLPWERRQSQNPYDLLDQSSLASTHIRVSYDQHFIQVYKQQQQKEQKKRKKNSKDYVADLFFFRYSSEREK